MRAFRIFLNRFFLLVFVGLVLPVPVSPAQKEPTHVGFIAGYKKAGDFLDPMGIFYDARNREIYVADTGNGRICLFTQDGMPEYEFRSYKDKDRTVNFVSPIDVAVNSSGLIFVSDIFLGEVVAMNFRGDLEFALDLTQAEPERISPGRIAVDAEDNLFVADGTNNQVLVFDAQGSFKFKFGKKSGEVPGIEKISAIYPDSRSARIYVTSIEGTSVLIFDYEGGLTVGFGIHDAGVMNFSFPAGIAALPDGDVYVADTLRSDIKVFNRSHEFQFHFGGAGFGGNATNFPADLDVDPDGNLYIVEKSARRVNIFSLPGAGDKEP